MKKIKLLMIDNYDSFTYNIVQYLGELGADVSVARNDEISLADIDARLADGELDRFPRGVGTRRQFPDDLASGGYFGPFGTRFALQFVLKRFF